MKLKTSLYIKGFISYLNIIVHGEVAHGFGVWVPCPAVLLQGVQQVAVLVNLFTNTKKFLLYDDYLQTKELFSEVQSLFLV